MRAKKTYQSEKPFLINLHDRTSCATKLVWDPRVDISSIPSLFLVYLHFNSKVWKVLLIVLGQHWKRLDLGAVWIRKCPVLLSIKFQYLLISSVHCVFIEGFKKLATDGSAVLIWALPQHSTFGEKNRLLFYYLVYYLFAAETKHLTKRTEKCLSWFSAPWQGRCGDRIEVEGHTVSTWEVESKGF